MQLKSSSQKKQAFALDTEGSISTKLASFQKFTDEMLARFGSSSTPPSQDVLDAVGTVLNFIDMMYDTLDAAHEADVGLAKACNTDIEKCDTDFMSAKIIQEIQNAKNAADNALTSHDDCRSNLVSDCECYCGGDGTCAEYDRYRKGDDDDNVPPNEVPSLPACVAKGHLSDAYITADADGSAVQVQMLEDMEQCLEDMKAWLDPLYERYDGCNRCDGDCTKGVDDCDKMQHDFQSARCLYALEHNLRCEGYYTCYEDKVSECETDCEAIGIRAAARAADNETGQRLVCLLETLFGKRDPSNSTGTGFFNRSSDATRPGELEACKNQTLIVGDWSITCPWGTGTLPSHDPPTPQVCLPKGVTVTSPCTTEFEAEMATPPSSWSTDFFFNSALTRCTERKLQRGMHGGVDECETQGSCIVHHSDHEYFNQK